jgi:hypothetical protein
LTREENTVKEPEEGQPGVERGAAEDAGGAPLTPTEEEASRRPPSDPGDQDDETSSGGDAQPDDFDPNDLE